MRGVRVVASWDCPPGDKTSTPCVVLWILAWVLALVLAWVLAPDCLLHVHTYVERYFCFVPFHPLAVLRGGHATQQDFVFLRAADGGGWFGVFDSGGAPAKTKTDIVASAPLLPPGPRIPPLPLSPSLSRYQVSYHTRNLLCVLQLHDGPILSLEVNEDYAITASEDKLLRLWPLDFSDFLMEAAHEVRLKTRREREKQCSWGKREGEAENNREAVLMGQKWCGARVQGGCGVGFA